METVTITFEDGTELTAERNGTSLIVDEKPDFPEEIGDVEIAGEDGTQTIENAQFIECAPVPGDTRYWFMFIPTTRDVDGELDQQRADIDYIAAVMDVEL